MPVPSQLRVRVRVTRPPSLRAIVSALPPFLTMSEASALLRRSRGAILELRRHGVLVTDKQPDDPRSRHVRISRDSIVAYLRERGLLGA